MDRVLILDFGSQYNQLIARRVRESKVYSEIVPWNITPDEIRRRAPRALILSGGPDSVRRRGAPLPDPGVFELGIPVLGICYGLQAIAKLLGGGVEAGTRREYGPATLKRGKPSLLLAGVPGRSLVWMSHGDRLAWLPRGFRTIASTREAPYAAVANLNRAIFGVQFHPEVSHTEFGRAIFDNFLFEISGCRRSWTISSFIRDEIRLVRDRVGKDKVLCAVSGGVDSTVMAGLLHKAIGRQLVPVFVDTGLLRKNEAEEVRAALAPRIGLRVVNARARFIERLKGVADPEEKRRRIGRTFIKVFEGAVAGQKNVRWLAQGTLYPDLVESKSAFGGPSATIKTHHNVGGLPARMKLKLIEPLKELFKDEVRALGRALKLPPALINRHPFPGPGLAVRILGAVTPERVRLLQEADHIFIDELRRAKLYDRVWQALAVLLPVRTVGVMGDERTYENAVVLRAVTSVDAMTADWARLPAGLLANVSNRIINEVRGINRVVYDISSKPPATIEWE